MPDEKSLLFSDAPVRKAVLPLAIPTVISRLITVVYNMADTFFIGQLNDSLQVAAATLAMPCFMFLTAFANLFGLGGYGLISRCLGSDNKDKARRTAVLCIRTGIAAVLNVMNAEFAHLIRSEGYFKQAGFGVALGGVLNIALEMKKIRFSH